MIHALKDTLTFKVDFQMLYSILSIKRGNTILVVMSKFGVKLNVIESFGIHIPDGMLIKFSFFLYDTCPYDG